jgi:hypothetical protein
LHREQELCLLQNGPFYVITVWYWILLGCIHCGRYRHFGWFYLYYDCIFNFVGNVMIFIFWMMQILTQIAECIRRPASTRIAHCHSSLLYPQWTRMVCAENSYDALHGSVTCTTALLFVNLIYIRCSLGFMTYTVITWSYS